MATNRRYPTTFFSDKLTPNFHALCSDWGACAMAGVCASRISLQNNFISAAERSSL